jgi:hypothetical protein
MLKRVNSSGFSKSTCLTIFFFYIQFFVFSQTLLLKGIVKDESTLRPVRDVNIKVYGTTKGTSTDKNGNFSIRLNKIPASLIITCIGYEIEYYDITDIPGISVEFLLSRKSYTLPEVDISSKQYSYLFKDKDYSVLDYEILGDNVLLLVFRYQLKRSELVLVSGSGDTLAISKLPELPPASLYKDFLSNVHYFSKAGNAYQCYCFEKNSSIEFIHKTTVDSLLTLVNPFIFQISDRLYFQENMANGFGTAIGFYEQGTKKKYIRQYFNEKKVSEYSDDQQFYARWNAFIAASSNVSGENINKDSRFYNQTEARAHQVFFWNMIFPVIKTKENNIAFFNFGSDIIELMDEDGKIINTVPISFHKEKISNVDSAYSIRLSNTGWRWGRKILTDDYNHNVFTLFHRNGMVQVRQIDLETGKLNGRTVLPFPFPEKIEIFKNEAYFLIKSDNANDKWKLVKCKL